MGFDTVEVRSSSLLVPTILPHARPLCSAEHNHRIVLCRFSAGFADSAGGPPERPQSLHQKPWPLGAGVSGAIQNPGGGPTPRAPGEIMEITPRDPRVDRPSRWLERPGEPGRSGVRVSSCLPSLFFDLLAKRPAHNPTAGPRRGRATD